METVVRGSGQRFRKGPQLIIECPVEAADHLEVDHRLLLKEAPHEEGLTYPSSTINGDELGLCRFY